MPRGNISTKAADITGLTVERTMEGTGIEVHNGRRVVAEPIQSVLPEFITWLKSMQGNFLIWEVRLRHALRPYPWGQFQQSLLSITINIPHMTKDVFVFCKHLMTELRKKWSSLNKSIGREETKQRLQQLSEEDFAFHSPREPKSKAASVQTIIVGRPNEFFGSWWPKQSREYKS